MRKGGAVPGMSRPAARGRAEHLLLAYPGRDIAVTAITVVLTAVVFAAVASQGVLAHIQHLDNAWLRLMVTHRSGPVTAMSRPGEATSWCSGCRTAAGRLTPGMAHPARTAPGPRCS